MVSEATADVSDTAITSADTAPWIAKAQHRVDQLRDAVLASGGASRRVVAECVTDVAQAPFGNFMLSWPLDRHDDMVLGHLPDGAFFLRLLELAYRPALDRRPDLRRCLQDRSRLEMAFTNDVLQVQAAQPPGAYSMIRHHALVLHAAEHWLDGPARDRWLQLYETIADEVAGRYAAADLADIEDAAFADFARLAGQTLDADAADELLADSGQLKNIIDYQLTAAAAIAVLERHRVTRGPAEMSAWMAQQLSAAAAEDYLLDLWQALL
ncbi:MAG TPA: hypothetical protein VKB75_03045 [Jatrophihabitans sp.]|nr:hypothetical protein [Jatrophihabitans sp.]